MEGEEERGREGGIYFRTVLRQNDHGLPSPHCFVHVLKQCNEEFKQQQQKTRGGVREGREKLSLF